MDRRTSFLQGEANLMQHLKVTERIGGRLFYFTPVRGKTGSKPSPPLSLCQELITGVTCPHWLHTTQSVHLHFEHRRFDWTNCSKIHRALFRLALTG